MTLTAVRQNDQLNPDSLLGYLEFHALPDLQIRKDDLATLWTKHNLPHEFLPGEIRPCDAFRRHYYLDRCLQLLYQHFAQEHFLSTHLQHIGYTILAHCQVMSQIQNYFHHLESLVLHPDHLQAPLFRLRQRQNLLNFLLRIV